MTKKPNPITPTASLLAEFSSRVESVHGECWTFRGHASADGYLSIYWRGKWYRASRLSYALHYNDLSMDMVVDHLCRNRWCVNPAHLEQVTNAENLSRGRNHRSSCGRGHPYTPENTGIQRVGGYTNQRYCKTCSRLRRRHRLGPRKQPSYVDQIPRAMPLGLDQA